MAAFQPAFNDYAADCAQFVRTARWAPTRPSAVDRYHELVDPLVTAARPDRRSARPELRRRDHRHHQRALHASSYWQYLTSGLLGLQRGTDAGDLLLLADDYQGRDPDGHYNNAAGRVQRDPLRRRAVADRPGGVGRRRPADPRRPRRS